MNRALAWTTENVIFCAVLYFAAIENSTINQYVVNVWIGFVALCAFIIQAGSWLTEWVFEKEGKIEHAISPMNRGRLRGTPVPHFMYIGLEVAYAAFFVSLGWYYLAALQIYIASHLIYTFDRELTEKAILLLAERNKKFKKLEGKPNAG